MDIMDFINESLEQQKKEQIEEEKIEKKEKKKLDIWEVLNAIANKDIEYYNNLSDDEKKLLQPYVVNLWLSMIYRKDKSKRLSELDIVYHELLRNVNDRLNKNLFEFSSKDMFWLVATTINEFDEFLNRFEVDYLKGKKSNKEKYDKDVIEYLTNELLTSSDKVIEMIENGYITDDILNEVNEIVKSKQAKIK